MRNLSAKGRKAPLALVAAGGYQLLDPQAIDEDEDEVVDVSRDDDKRDGDGPELEVEYLELVNDPHSDEHAGDDDDSVVFELDIEYTELVGPDQDADRQP